MEGYTFSKLMQKPKSLFIFSVYSTLALPEKKNKIDCAVFNRDTYLEVGPDHFWFFEEFLTFQLAVQI